jgi:hypothetical protein
MPAPDTVAKRNGRDARRTKKATLCARLMAYGWVVQVLGSLFVALMTVVLSANTAFAHTYEEARHEYSAAQLPQRGGFARTVECTSKVDLFDAAGSVLSWSAEIRAMPIGDESDDVECDTCCGVACHAAVNVGTDDTLRRVPPLGRFAPGGPPALVGRSQGPPERPPWITVRLSSRPDAAGWSTSLGRS